MRDGTISIIQGICRMLQMPYDTLTRIIRHPVALQAMPLTDLMLGRWHLNEATVFLQMAIARTYGTSHPAFQQEYRLHQIIPPVRSWEMEPQEDREAPNQTTQA